MDILGNIGYAILIFFAITWTMGVRRVLGAGLFTIVGALFYVVAVIVLGVFGINKLHSWWILPSGFIFVWLCTLILAHDVPLLCTLIKIFGSFYSGVVRIGIPIEKIQEAQRRDAYETVYGLTDGAKLSQAAKNGDFQKVQSLLADGVEINARDYDGKTALGWAAWKGHTEIVKLLLEKGADANAKTKEGETALMLAVEKKHIEIIHLLLAKGADINVKTADNGQTALMTATSKKCNAEIVGLLLESGAEVNIKNNKGATALIAASCIGDAEIVNTLLENGADVNERTDNGITALLAARKNGFKDITQMLEKAGARE